MIKRPTIITGVTVVFCVLLCSGIVFADDDASVDDVSIVVPTACTLSGTGTGTHNATINPGQYVADIGTTTLKALCNDANGFAIYAAGYTGNTIGETNSNKLVGQNTSETIVTGLATSGDTSNWAMKLATDSTATYPVTIESAPNTSGGSDASFSAYHVVPNEYTKVATRLQFTDVGTNATGSTLTSTYATYVSAGQVGDTYNGKVIYTLVHPNNSNPPVGENQIGVIYDGNGLFFDQAETRSTNKVIYEKSCVDEYGYIGDTPAILKTRNLNNDGTQNGPYSYEGSTYYEGDGLDTDYVDFEGASRVKIVIRYGLTQNTAFGPDIAVNKFSVEDEAANNT
ncbi:hypothetical protein IIW29_00030 [Candidatus Saccharibacteria bacterium]|nr:hypothetical protein [Candidatus Saccharibacteria bacterium]